MKKVCLKIDIDTHDGMKNGVPALLEDLASMDARATFCLSLGPDNAGKAIFRLLSPAFLKKMLRTGAPRLYGLRTILSGTLLPARPIATAFPELCKRITAEGHEAAVHAWDHRKWQDHLKTMNENEIKAEFQQAFQAYKRIFGRKPLGVAAPGWQATPLSLAVEDQLGLLYASDLREPEPCFVQAEGRRFSTLQIPTTGPCIEELLAMGIRDEQQMEDLLIEAISKARQPVLAVHAEVEGGIFRPLFRRLMVRLARHFDGFATLQDIAEGLLSNPETIPVFEFYETRLPGRAGMVASAISRT